MKTIILTLAMAFIAFGAFSINNAAMACSSCGCAEMKSDCNCAKKKEMKPCTKCLDAGKTCNCASKKSHSHAKKPCTVCEKSDKEWNKKHKKHKSMHDHSEKGSLTIRSGSAEGSRYN